MTKMVREFPGNAAARRGFTLVELMIVVAILAILASVAIPKYADMILKAQEGSLKGNLGMVRSALSIYYADNQGIYPSCAVGAGSSIFDDALVPKYIGFTPSVKNGIHPPNSSVYCDLEMLPGIVHDAQGWYYDGAAPADNLNGSVWVACDHTDIIGNSWTSY